MILATETRNIDIACSSVPPWQIQMKRLEKNVQCSTNNVQYSIAEGSNNWALKIEH